MPTLESLSDELAPLSASLHLRATPETSWSQRMASLVPSSSDFRKNAPQWIEGCSLFVRSESATTFVALNFYTLLIWLAVPPA